MLEPKKRNEIATTPVGRIKKLAEKLKDYSDEQEVSFELVITYLFPTVWKNVQKYGSDCFIQGYLQAKEEANENKGNN